MTPQWTNVVYMRFTRAEPDGGSVGVVLTLLSFGFSEASSRRYEGVNTDS